MTLHPDTRAGRPGTGSAATVGFSEGSTVLTRAGAQPAADLAPGARVITRDGGLRTLAAVMTRSVTEGTLVRIAAGALGPARPERDLLLAPGQPVLLRGARAVALFGVAQAIVPAECLIDGDAVTRVPVSAPHRLCRLCFEADHLVYAEGLELLCRAAAPG